MASAALRFPSNALQIGVQTELVTVLYNLQAEKEIRTDLHKVC